MSWDYYEPKFEYEADFQDLGGPWAGHKYFAYDLVRNVSLRRIVELGTEKGTSFFSFCQGVKDGGLDIELNAIDTWKGDQHTGPYDESVFLRFIEIKNAHYSGLNINLLKRTFDDALDDFENHSIDLLHIDGTHAYEAVKHDFESWFNKVKDGGIILFHDVAEKREDFEVYKLWQEIKEKYKTIEFSHSHGLGVLFKNPQDFNNFFDFQEIWQHYYSALAEKHLYHFEINNNINTIIILLWIAQKNNQEIANLNQDLANLNQLVQQYYQKLAYLNQLVLLKDQELSDIKSTRFWKLREEYIKVRKLLKF